MGGAAGYKRPPSPRSAAASDTGEKKVLLTIGFFGSQALKILEVQEQFVFNVYGVLYFDFVDCIQKPGYPGRSIFFLKSAKKLALF